MHCINLTYKELPMFGSHRPATGKDIFLGAATIAGLLAWFAVAYVTEENLFYLVGILIGPISCYYAGEFIFRLFRRSK